MLGISNRVLYATRLDLPHFIQNTIIMKRAAEEAPEIEQPRSRRRLSSQRTLNTTKFKLPPHDSRVADDEGFEQNRSRARKNEDLGIKNPLERR